MDKSKWYIRESHLGYLWDIAFPRVLAKIWNNEIAEKDLNPAVERYMKDKFGQHVELPPLGINKDARFALTFTNEGIQFPWPPKPIVDKDVFDMYVTRQLFPEPMNIPIINSSERPTWSFPDKDPGPWVLRGDDLDGIVQGWPRIVANVWSSDDLYSQFMKHPDYFIGYLEAQEELSFPRNFDVVVSTDAAELFITSRGLVIPFPERPSLEDMFEAWSKGEAVIPTFTTCVCIIGGA